jgi:hypothetical protein
MKSRPLCLFLRFFNSLAESKTCRKYINLASIHLNPGSIKHERDQINAPPSNQDTGAKKQTWGTCGDTNQILGKFLGDKGDVEVPSMGSGVSKFIKIKNRNDKIPTITIHPMQIHHCAV